MSFNKVGFGIIGTGAVAAAHAMAITHSEFADLVAVYDVVPERAKELLAMGIDTVLTNNYWIVAQAKTEYLKGGNK